jgi:transcription termination/antitermination protein NusG
MMKKWYVVHTMASHEFKIRDAIERTVKGTHLEDKVGQILIPTQNTFHIRDGKRIPREKKLFNSYLILELELTPEVYSFIGGLPGVTYFLGSGKKPQPLTEKEVNKLLGYAERESGEGEEYNFLPGDIVKITEGPFSEFEGVVEKANMDSGKLIVKVTVFGRVTPVEVKLDQVEVM